MYVPCYPEFCYILNRSIVGPLAFALFNTSRSIAAMVSKGLLANIGAHGEPPLGLNYHAEMGFTGKGGLSNYEVGVFLLTTVR